jgi:hypothetical protein
MQQCVHSRLALRTLLKFRTCAERLIACEWTCWGPSVAVRCILWVGLEVDNGSSGGYFLTGENAARGNHDSYFRGSYQSIK